MITNMGLAHPNTTHTLKHRQTATFEVPHITTRHSLCSAVTNPGKAWQATFQYHSLYKVHHSGSVSGDSADTDNPQFCPVRNCSVQFGKRPQRRASRPDSHGPLAPGIAGEWPTPLPSSTLRDAIFCPDHISSMIHRAEWSFIPEVWM